jgi:APA family basic amino acid/polyamine antiporter
MSSTPEAAGFRRELGLFDAAVVVAGGVIGVGIFANPANVARVLGDPVLILLAWIIGGIVALLGGFIWAELASRLPHVGGQYVYLARAYHPVVGFLYGIALLFIINGGALAAVAILFASYVDRSFIPLGGPTGIRLVAAAALITLTAINAIGIRAGKVTNNLLMAAKVTGMLALVALAFGHGATPASHFDMANVTITGSSVSLLFTALVPILFAYGGWQNCASIAGEIKDPARNLARANVIGVVIVVTLYLSLNVAYLWVLTPSQIAASPALAADMARAVAGELGARFVATLIVISSLGFLAVIILTGARLSYAMAADGVFFARAGRLHPKHRTPVFALWFQTVVSLALLTTNTYDQLLSYVVFADWLFFGLTAASLFVLRREAHTQARAADSAGDSVPPAGVAAGAAANTIARVPGHPVTTLLFVAVAVGIVVNSFIAYTVQSLIGTTILIIATIAYFAIARPRS